MRTWGVKKRKRRSVTGWEALVTSAPLEWYGKPHCSVERAALMLRMPGTQCGLTVTLSLRSTLDGHQLGIEAALDHCVAADGGLRKLDFDFHHGCTRENVVDLTLIATARACAARPGFRDHVRTWLCKNDGFGHPSRQVAQ